MLLSVVTVAACSGGDSASQAPASAPTVTPEASSETALDPCANENLTVVNPGQLTVAIVGPVAEPMFVAGKPGSGEGFESALVFALAGDLGFSRTQVAWIDGTLSTVVDTGALGTDGRRADFAIGQVSAPAPPGTELSVPYLVGPADDQAHALAFVEGNPLRSCVDTSLVGLAADGAVEDLARVWLAGTEWAQGLVGPSATRVS